MNFLEKDLETLICETYQKDPAILMLRGLYMEGEMFRQMNLGPYGIADLVTFKMNTDKLVGICTGRVLKVHIYELKKDAINPSTLLQALGYCKGIERIIEDSELHAFDVEFEITLIGKTIDLSSNFCYATDFIKNLNFYTYSASIEKGFEFNLESGYSKSSDQNNLPGMYAFSKQKLKNILINQTKTYRRVNGQEVYR